MDIWFFLFVLFVSLSVAVGFSLFMVGYISIMPISFGKGRNWLWAAGIVPSAIVILPMFGDAVLNVFGTGNDPFVLAKWLAIPALTLHFGAVFWFAFSNRTEYAKPAWQLAVGLLLLAAGGGLLYGLGPHFVDRIVAGAK